MIRSLESQLIFYSFHLLILWNSFLCWFFLPDYHDYKKSNFCSNLDNSILKKKIVKIKNLISLLVTKIKIQIRPTIHKNPNWLKKFATINFFTPFRAFLIRNCNFIPVGLIHNHVKLMCLEILRLSFSKLICIYFSIFSLICKLCIDII